jgi:deoxyribose-phosphate aldolase
MPHPLAQYLDFANHRADATPADIEKLCKNVLEYGFHAAFVNAAYITLAKKLLGGKARVGTVVSFPLGQDTIASKVAAVNEAVTLGADELDVVPNIGIFLAGDINAFTDEMKTIVDGARMARLPAPASPPAKPGEAARDRRDGGQVGRAVIVKFILDPGYMNTSEQMKQAALAIQQSGADFVKIGSGMGPRGPSVEDVATVRAAVGPAMNIKVAGGIDTYQEAKAFIDAGASRIGTSHAVEIVTHS